CVIIYLTKPPQEPVSTNFPYTTLFRSGGPRRGRERQGRDPQHPPRRQPAGQGAAEGKEGERGRGRARRGRDPEDHRQGDQGGRRGGEGQGTGTDGGVTAACMATPPPAP